MKPDRTQSQDLTTHALEGIGAWVGEGSINIFGSPFAGKDTQGPRLARALGAPLVGGGALLREVEAELPADVLAVMHEGGLIDSLVFEQHVVPHIQDHAVSGAPLILSAFGRMQGEEDMAMRALAASGHPLKAALVLQISPDEVWRRWQEERDGSSTRGNRADDSRASLERRLQEFAVHTLPVLQHYRSMGLLVEVNGEGDQDAVFLRICERLAVGAPTR